MFYNLKITFRRLFRNELYSAINIGGLAIGMAVAGFLHCILAICFIIAAPLAWYVVTRWLEKFVYKTPMYWWVYLLAFVAVGIIIVATVTFQNWRVANNNPVNTIKRE